MASTYAAMLAIVNIGTLEAYDCINIDRMFKFLMSVKSNLIPKEGSKNIWELC